MEQLSLCIRYVHPDNNSIQEHFVGFTPCYKLDATSLATQIISEVEKLGLSMKNCLAQCYDGAVSHEWMPLRSSEESTRDGW